MNGERASLFTAVRRGVERTNRLLFRPFNLRTWLVLGFVAWLAGMPGCNGGFNSSFSAPGSGIEDTAPAEAMAELREGLGEVWGQVAAGGCFAFLALGCFLLIALALVILWVSARAQFIFLDDVLESRALVVEPWKRLRSLGNSLFGFELCLAAGWLLLFVVLGGSVAALHLAMPSRLEWLAIVGTAVLILMGAAAAILGVFVTYFTRAYVVPLMHRYELGAVAGWRRFAGLFRRHPLYFLLSAFLQLGLQVVLGMLTLAFGCLTCCLGLLLLAIPYVGTVILLPIPVFFRSYTIDVLAQIDPGLFGLEERPEAPL